MRLSTTGRAVLALLVIGVALLGASGSMAHGGKAIRTASRSRFFPIEPTCSRVGTRSWK